MPEETKYHPLCLMFPLLPQDELQKLGEDLKTNGFRFPIVRWHGMVVDGRNRLEACKLVGISPTFRDRDDVLKTEEDVAKFIFSANISRRHLSASERAVLAVEFKAVIEKAAKDAAAAAGKEPAKKVGGALKQAAAQAQVSESYVATAEQLKKDAPAKFEEVKAGKKSLGAAKKEAEEEKGAAAGAGKQGGGKVIPAEAGEQADEEAELRKAEKIVAKCQTKLGELGYRLVDDTVEPL